MFKIKPLIVDTREDSKTIACRIEFEMEGDCENSTDIELFRDATKEFGEWFERYQKHYNALSVVRNGRKKDGEE